MSNQPLVSVVTPVYNGADFIAECIESVLRQSYKNFEFIIGNNCSKDDTLAIAQRYAAQDSRIKLFDNDTFLGVIDNHNLAFSRISPESKYVKVISADDWLFDECLEKLVALAEANPSVGLVGSYSLAGNRLLYDGLDCNTTVVPGREVARNTLMGGPYLFGAPTSLLYRADLVRRNGFKFYPTASPHADTSACYEAMTISDFGFVHQVLTFRRIHADTQTSNSVKFGTIKRSLISDMATYGPKFLTPEELELHLGLAVEKYYSWLVPALFENSFGKEFLEKQRKGMEEIGYELDMSKILKAALGRGLELLENPGVSLRKIPAMLKRRGKVQARYY